VTTLRRAAILLVLEGMCVGFLLVAPGNGHSIVWLTLFPAMVIVAHTAPAVGSCLECAPGDWAVGIAVQSLLLILVAIVWPYIDPWRTPSRVSSASVPPPVGSSRRPRDERS